MNWMMGETKEFGLCPQGLLAVNWHQIAQAPAPIAAGKQMLR